MSHFSERYLKTGGDPRMLPDYAALRDELAKLSHPARPDVNWRYAEKLCLSLFEQNGVELQTAAWYTLARTQLAGLFGLNEGLSILEALISHQWGALWPQPVHARMEILSSLSQRIQQLMRTLALNYGDLSQLYRAEQQFSSMGTILQRLELKHLSQFDTLCTLMHNSAARLENAGDASDHIAALPGIMLPADATQLAGISVDGISAISNAGKSEPASAVKWVYVAQPEHKPNVEVVTEIAGPKKPWKPFAAGMATMLVISTATVWGWQSVHRPDPLQEQLAASMAPLPLALSPTELETLRQQVLSPEALVNETQRQLTRLDQLPPDWAFDYGYRLVQQINTLWPEQAKPLAAAWQQQLNATALPVDQMSGWHQGMMKLQQLSDRLNGLDEKKGKYMTVSELKSVVYSTTQAFNRLVPAEELLRRYADSSSDIQLRQVEMAVEQLQKRYFLLHQKQGDDFAKQAEEGHQ